MELSTEIRRKLFIQGFVNSSNFLPQRAVGAQSLYLFKAEINRFLDSKGIWGSGAKMDLRDRIRYELA